jgi:hypothetical protein
MLKAKQNVPPNQIPPPIEGWALLQNSQKWHYFRKGQSLCHKRMMLGHIRELDPNTRGRKMHSCRHKAQWSISDLDTRTIRSPDNCTACFKRRQVEIAKRHTATKPEVKRFLETTA